MFSSGNLLRRAEHTTEPLASDHQDFVPCETALPLQSNTDGRSLCLLLHAAAQNPVDGC